MRLGIDLTSHANRRGYGRYTRELVGALLPLASDHDCYCVVEEQNAAQLEAFAEYANIVAVPQTQAPVDAAGDSSRRGIRDVLAMRRAVSRLKPDLMFFPTVYTWFPIPCRVPSVVCIHDAIAERFPELTLPKWRSRFFWNRKVRAAIRASKLVMTVSDFSARDLHKYLGIRRESIRVTNEAPSAMYRPVDQKEIAASMARVGLQDVDRWFIYVGGFNPHKRVDSIIRAHARHAAGDSEAPHLLLVGAADDSFHGCFSELRALAENSGAADKVHWTGYVTDDDLCPLISGALASLLVSSCEGFGLPAVEAAACGTPAIATTESPLPQVLDGGGIFIEPDGDDGLLMAMQELSNNHEMRAEMATVALRRAQDLSWERAAQCALEALEEVVA